MCDLGTSINVMPLSIFNLLNAGTLKGTSIVIQLANRSVVYPKGVLEDVLVQVDQLIFPADFYVIDIEEDKSNTTSDILLGRPFLSTARTKIDVHDGTLTMEFEGEVIKFNVYDTMKFPNDVSPVYGLDVIDDLSQEIFDFDLDNSLNDELCRSKEMDSTSTSTEKDTDQTTYCSLLVAGDLPKSPVQADSDLPKSLERQT